jgi:hypothetical protein
MENYMINKLIFAGLAYYFYTDMKKKLNAAIADREALLGMLNPEQKASLLQGIAAAQGIASETIRTVSS